MQSTTVYTNSNSNDQPIDRLPSLTLDGKKFYIDSCATISVVQDDTTQPKFYKPVTLKTVTGEKQIIEFQTNVKLDNNDIPAIVLDKQQGNIISVLQLSKMGYTTIFTPTKIILVQPDALTSTQRQLFQDILGNKLVRSNNLPGVQDSQVTDKTIDLPGSQDPQATYTAYMVELINDLEDLHLVDDVLDETCDMSEFETETVLATMTDNGFIFKLPDDPSPGYVTHCRMGHMTRLNMQKVHQVALSPTEKLEIDQCILCFFSKFRKKSRRIVPHGPNTSTQLTQIHMDMFEQKLVFTNQKQYVCVLVDEYSRYVWTASATNKSTLRQSMMLSIANEQEKLGKKTLFYVSDRGTENNLSFEGINWRKAPTGDKQFNGLAERHVQNVKDKMDLVGHHLLPYPKEQYFEAFLKHTTLMCNLNPNSTINNEVPMNRYYSGIKHFVEPTTLPLLLEDCVVLYNHRNKEIKTLAFFLEYNHLNRTYKFQDIQANHRTTFEVSSYTYTPMRTFNLHKEFKEHNPQGVEIIKRHLVQNKYDITDIRRGLQEIVSSDPRLDSSAPQIVHKLSHSHTIPNNLNSALRQPAWNTAVMKEVQSFLDLEVYEEYHPKPGDKVTRVTNWYLFSMKNDQFIHQKIEKARLIHVVPEEIRQHLGDPSPVVKNTTLMVIWILYAELKTVGYKFITVDIYTAFLTANIDINAKHKDKIFVTKPSLPFADKFSTPLVKLKKSCYGLNIAPKNFYLKLTAVLTNELNYQVSPGDPCLYHHESLGIIVCHVDDLAILSKTPDKVQSLIHAHLKTKVDHQPEYYVGYELEETADHFSFGATQYIETKFTAIFDERELNFIASPTYSPSTSHFKHLVEPRLGKSSTITEEFVTELAKTQENKKRVQQDSPSTKTAPKPWIYFKPQSQFTVKRSQQLIGVLTYLASHSRWDIKYYVSILSRYSGYPSSLTYMCILHLYRFIYTTREFRTTFQFNPDFSATEHIQVDIYSDASFKHTDSRNAYKGYLITINDHYWDSKSSKIDRAAKSSFHTELLAAAQAVEFVMKKHMLLDSIVSVTGLKPIKYTLHIDNSALLKNLTAPDAPTEMEKYYSNPLNILRDHIKYEKIEVKHVPGEHNPGDGFTKAAEPHVRQRLYNETVLNTMTNANDPKVKMFRQHKLRNTSEQPATATALDNTDGQRDVDME